MDHPRLEDNPGEGSNVVIEIADDSDVIYIDSESEGSVQAFNQKSSSLSNNEVVYVKTAGSTKKPVARKQQGLSKASLSPPRKDKVRTKSAHIQDKAHPPKKRRMSSTVLMASMNDNEPRAVKPSSKEASKNNTLNQPKMGKNSSMHTSRLDLKHPPASITEQSGPHLPLSPSRKMGPNARSSVDADSSHSVTGSLLSRPSTPPVEWLLTGEGRALTSSTDDAQSIKDYGFVNLYSPVHDSADLKKNKLATKSVLVPKSTRKRVATLPEHRKQENSSQADQFYDEDSDSSSCLCLEVTRSPFRKVYGRNYEEAIYIASSSDDDFDEDVVEDLQANSKRDLSQLQTKKFVYRESNKDKSHASRNAMKNSSENRRVNLSERKEERRLQAVLAGNHENLMSPGRSSRMELDKRPPVTDGSRSSQFSKTLTDCLLASNLSPGRPSHSTQHAGEPTQQSKPDISLRNTDGSQTSLPSSSVSDRTVINEKPKALDNENVSNRKQDVSPVVQENPIECEIESSIEDNEDESRQFHAATPLSKTTDKECAGSTFSSLSGSIERPKSFEIASRRDVSIDLSVKKMSLSEDSNFDDLHINTDMDVSISLTREKRKVGLKKALKRVNAECKSVLSTNESFEPTDQGSVCSDDEDMELPACMLSVKHWSRKYVNKVTNLPVWEFTTYGGDDSILYSFRAFAAKSTIPGAGLGAFIEFTGARRMIETSNERRLRILDLMVQSLPKTMRPLQAILEEGGSGISVYLKGENLHGNLNREYRPDYLRKTLVAQFPSRPSQKVNVRLVSRDDLHEILEYEAFFVRESSSIQPIGHLNMHTDCDYDFDKGISEFYTDSNCIDLGRYGPFQQSDRKPEDYFVLKSFIFCQVPVEWGFGAIEKLHGMDQYIDITDDVTGLPSYLAKKEIPMYVNEIGHKLPRKQNVFIKDSWDNRVINYYFMPTGPLQKGVPVELLTNYKSAYEGVRERKGYGRRNANHEIYSDDCIAARLERNFAEREDCELLLESKSVTRLSFLIQKIDSDIFRPLINMVGKSKLSPLQWIAMRRVYWLVDCFRRKLKTDSESVKDKSLLDYYEPMIDGILRDMETVYRKTFTPLINNDKSLIHSCREINDAFYEEILEEVCFDLRFWFPRILDTSLFCPVAVRLIVSFSKCFAKLWLFRDSDCNQEQLQEKLLGSLYDLAIDAKEEILACINGSDPELSCLQFTSGLSKKYSLVGSTAELIDVAKECGAFSLQSTFPKGITAAIVEKMESTNDEAVELGNKLVMVNYAKVIVYSGFKDLGAAPCPVSKVQTHQINISWYLLTQVVWVIHGFAAVLMKDSSYSLAELCDKLQLNLSDAEFMVGLGSKVDDGLHFKKFLQEIAPDHIDEVIEQKATDSNSLKSPVESEENLKSSFGVSRPSAELVYEGPPTTKFPGTGDWPEGWIQRTYKRASGFTVGRLDHYWLPSTKGPKLRSTVEVLRYLVDSYK